MFQSITGVTFKIECSSNEEFVYGTDVNQPAPAEKSSMHI